VVHGVCSARGGGGGRGGDADDLVRAHGESVWSARLAPLTVDGLIYASSMVMLDSARRKMPVPALASLGGCGLGSMATLAANIALGLGHGLIGATVAAWPAVALVGAWTRIRANNDEPHITRASALLDASELGQAGELVTDPIASETMQGRQ
jgi:hypothetical protein